jgi:hopanoid biosynthesis associated RND transporter like protein HpnN
MRRFFDQRSGAAIVRLVCDSARHHLWVLAAVALVTPFLGLYSVRHLGVNAEMASLFDDDLPHRVLDLELKRLFPSSYENLVVVVDGPTAERASRAARRIAARMTRYPDEFRYVFYSGSRFFERNALLYADREEVEATADRLARAQPYLTSLASDPTLRGLADILAKGAQDAADAAIDTEQLSVMLQRVTSALESQEHGHKERYSWAEMFLGADTARAARRQVIIAQPVLDITRILAAERPIERLRSWSDRAGRRGVRIRVTGDMALAYDELKVLQIQMVWASIASFLIVATSMIFAFRSVRLVIVASTNMLVGLIWTMAFAALAIGHLNMISVAFAVLFIGLSDDYAVHFCMRYRELRRSGLANMDALAGTARDAGIAISICAATTALGFYAFVPTSFRGVAELGLISGTGMVINVLLCFTSLPALITLATGSAKAFPRRVGPELDPFSVPLPVRRPRLVIAGTAVAAIASLSIIPKVHFDANPLHVRDPSTESVQVFEDLIADGSGSPWNVSVVIPPEEVGEDLVRALRNLPEVESALTIHDFVPSEQDEKLAVLQDIALFLFPTGDKKSPRAPVPVKATRNALHRLRDASASLAKESSDSSLAASAAGLVSGLDRFLAIPYIPGSADDAIEHVERSLLATFPSQLRRLDRMLGPTSVTIDDLPSALVDRMVGIDARLRVEIYPALDLNEDAALGEFVDAVRRVAPTATGGAVSVYESKREVVRAFRKAFAMAVVAIAALLFAMWRVPTDAALAMIPLALAALFTTALAYLFGIPFNYANVIVLPLLFGLGVNSGIHLVERWRLGDTPPEHILSTSTAKAVVYSSLNTVGSFGTLAFTSHRGMASMGQLLALGVSLTVICNLLILPALIAQQPRDPIPPSPGPSQAPPPMP